MTVVSRPCGRSARRASDSRPSSDTNGKPSPLFGAQPYTQQLLLFEEFGTEKLDPTLPAPPLTYPVPTVGPLPQQDPDNIARSGPSSSALEAFMRQPGLSPFPSQFSNVLDRNPWKAQIETFLNRHPVGSPAEGRPLGKGWSHQRWNEFYPQVAFKTVQAGAKLNGGMRDRWQLHNYAVGEFGPGGLYYQTSDIPTTTGTTKGIDTRFHPSMPVQNHNALWIFDGTFPPKLLMVRYGQPVLMRHYNALPIDPSANMGFGLHTISTHEHNGHSPAESDGYTNAFFFPGQYYDYRWPLQLAGYDTINTTAQDPRAAFPCAPGEKLFVNDASPGLKTCDNGTIKIRGDWRETMSTHWFHDHMLDFTAQNVYKGNAVMMNYYSALDRGNEAIEEGVNLRLPSGSALPWGNRDYDVNLVVADKAWDANGQLWFNPFNSDGFLGDQILVNWQFQPRLKVRARSYRFRILNGSVSRYFRIALVREIAGNGGEFPGPSGSGVSYNRVPFHMIGNDGNLMEHAVPFDGSMDLDGDGDKQNHNAILPTQGIAERFDIIVNFAKNGIKTGDKLYFVNLMEHKTGKGPEKNALSLADVLSEKYKAVIKQGSKGPEWDKGDPVVGKFMQMIVQPYTSLLLRWDIEHPGQFQLMPTPLPGWDGVTYVNSAALPTFRNGDGNGNDDDDDDNKGQNKKPIANADSATSSNGQPVSINVLANDTDPDGNVPLKVVGLAQPDSGQGTASTDGVRVIYTPPASVTAPFTATFTYQASDAKNAISEPATVSVAVTGAAVNEDLVVTSATVTARCNNRYTWDLAGTTSRGTGNTLTVTATTTAGPLNLGNAILTPTGTGARWRVSVTTTGSGPSSNPTVTISSAFGKSITVQISSR
nr:MULTISPECIES: Ig-like domain-containing protein [unclassified Pseudomonas]